MINVEYKQSKNQKIAFNKAKKRLSPNLFKQYKIEVDLSFDDENFQILGTGKGFDVSCYFYNDHLQFDVNLSLLLRPLKGKIESSILKELEKNV